MLLFHTELYPIGLVVEVLLSFIRPYPTLLLHVARLELVLAHQAHKLNEKQPWFHEGQSNCCWWYLQGAIRKQKIRRHKDIVKEVQCYCIISVKVFGMRRCDALLIPSSDALLILPATISPLKGLNTMRRHSTMKCQQCSLVYYWEQIPFTLTMPVPCPMRPSDAERISYTQMQRPIFWTTCILF